MKMVGEYIYVCDKPEDYLYHVFQETLVPYLGSNLNLGERGKETNIYYYTQLCARYCARHCIIVSYNPHHNPVKRICPPRVLSSVS